MNLCIESMTELDLDQVMKIENKSFSLPWTRSMFEQELHLPNSYLVVAKLNGEIAGYAGFWQVLEELHLITLAVKAGYRCQGIAKKIMNYLLKQGLGMGLQRATLEVRVSNMAAQALYKKFGFEPVAIRKKYYADNQEDALIMWLENLAEVGEVV